MWKLKNRHSNKGFTITELAITIFVISILSGMGLLGFSKITVTSQQTQCINNLREISQGLQLYHNDMRTFPDDGYPDDANDSPLYTELASYVPTKSVFVCPADKDTASSSNYESYDPYYVARPGSYQAEELVIGCPRHSDAKNSTSLFSMGSTEVTNIGTVEANGQVIPADGTTAQRTIDAVGDKMTFADNSTVEITNAAGGGARCFLVQSVLLADGTLYSIVRVEDTGTIDVTVSSGSKFEIVTPSAIVGVRGTHFTVQTSITGETPRTDVTLIDGTVILMDRITGETTTLTEGGITAASAETNMHDHWHWHADGTYHTHNHPDLNLAHHGNPALAMKVAASAGGGTDADVDQALGDFDQVLIDFINELTNTSKDVYDLLIAASPLSDAVLIAMINRVQPLNSNDNYWVLDANSPLSEGVLNTLVNKEGIMTSVNYGWILVNNSSLPSTILDQICAGSPATMSENDREWVDDANSEYCDN